ncbi:glycosyltransferase [Microbacterium sp. NPDC076911]|uniref:glycosyltransferase n=1 Tax=Microbacterium sp. NPDC076911 TaxID=3154958 RepID=UPI003443FA9A
MKIMLITAGSRGDVEPFAAFARGAHAAGHEVRLAVPDNSGVDLSALDAVSLGADFSAMIADQGVSPLAAMRSFRTTVKPAMRAVIVNSVRESLEFAPDVLMYHPKIVSAPLIADHLGIPHIMVEAVPVTAPTRAFPAPGTITANLGGAVNKLTYKAVGAAGGMFRQELAEAAALLGSSATKTSDPSATMVTVSPHLLARPADWPERVHLTGPWMVPASRTVLDAALDEFIAEPFVYAGFGSMAAGNAADRGRSIIEATRARSIRTLIATGWGGIDVSEDLRGDDVFVTDSVPHAQVMARASAAIHHGGAGTVHTAARAGITSIVVPFIADQPFWGKQLHDAGLAPAPVAYRRVSAATIGAALDAVPVYESANRALAERMADEDGIAAALEIVEATC